MAIVTFISSCGSPLNDFYRQIKYYGYMPYTTPLMHSGTGTLIGGMILIVCLLLKALSYFPNEVSGLEQI